MASEETWQEECDKMSPVEVNKFLGDEAKKCYKKWSETRLLNGIEGEYKKFSVAILLENQRLMNENSDSGDMSQFKRISIPKVRRIFGETVLHELVSVQPMIGPFGLAYHFEKRTKDGTLQLASKEIGSRTRKLKAVWTYEAQQDLRSQYNLDAEIELTTVLAQEIRMEIELEVCKDLIDNAGFKKDINFNCLRGDTLEEKYEKIKSMLVELGVENENISHGFEYFPNWMVMNSGVAEALFPNVKIQNSFDVKKHCVFETNYGPIDVYHHVLINPSTILMGKRGESYLDSGYVYSPYVPLIQTPTVLDAESFVLRRGFLTRYSKALINPSYYSVLNIKNIQLPKKEEK